MPSSIKQQEKVGLGIAQAGMRPCILWGSDQRDPHPKATPASPRGGPSDAPYLGAEAGGIEDGDLVGAAGPEGLIQRQEGSHGAGAHGQAGGLFRQLPQPPCSEETGMRGGLSNKEKNHLLMELKPP